MSVVLSPFRYVSHYAGRLCGLPGKVYYLYPKMRAHPEEHSDLISSFGYLALDTAIFAAKLFKQFPQVIGRASSVALNYMGVVELNFQWDAFWKNHQDSAWAYRAGEKTGFFISALKTSLKGIDIILCCGLFAASIFTLFGYASAALTIYKMLRPVGVITYFPFIGLIISDYFVNKSLVNRMKAIKEAPDKIKRVVDQILINGGNRSEEKTLGLLVVRQLDHNVFKTLETKLKENKVLDYQEMWSSLTNGIEKKLEFTKKNMGLTVLGYLFLGLCRAYPDTLLQSGLQWFICLLYTSKSVEEKYDQEKLRDRIVQL